MLGDTLCHDAVYTMGEDSFHMYHECFLSDLVILYAGFKNSVPGDFYGPAARDHFVYHYIVKGKARFETLFETYEATAGCGFLSFPNEQVKYVADDKEPAVHFRFGFKGNKAMEIVKTASMTVKTPVIYHTNLERATAIMNGFLLLSARDTLAAAMEAHALFYEMIAFWTYENKLTFNKRKVFRQTSVQEGYIANALSYIEQHYNKNIQVSHIAEHLNINASYFSRIFRAAFHMTASAYLQQFRLEAAKNLLANSTLTINQIAEETGFIDSAYFISIFRKKLDMTPKQYRDKHKE